MRTETVAYRYRDVMYAGLPLMTIDGSEDFGPSTLKIECHEYKVLRHTPKGFWIEDYSYLHDPNYERWVGLEHKKQYASLTKEEAMQHFIARKKRQIQIYTARLKSANKALEMALGQKETFDG